MTDDRVDISGARPSKKALEKMLAATGRDVPAECHNHIAHELISVKANYLLWREAYSNAIALKDRDDAIVRLSHALASASREPSVIEALRSVWPNVSEQPHEDPHTMLAQLSRAAELCLDPRFPQTGLLKHQGNDKDLALNFCITELFNIWVLWLGLELDDRQLSELCSVCVSELKINAGGEGFKARVRRLRRKQQENKPPYFYPMRGVASAANGPPIDYRPPFKPNLLEEIYGAEYLPLANSVPS